MKKLIVVILISISYLLSDLINLELNKEELEYLKNKKELIVHFEKNWKPYEFVNNNNNYEGYIHDIQRLIFDTLKLKIIYSLEAKNIDIEKLKLGKIDLMFDINKNDNSNLIFSDLSLNTEYLSLLSFENYKYLYELKGKRIGVKKGSLASKLLSKYHNIRVVEYIDESYFKDLERKRIDALYHDNNILDIYLKNHNKKNKKKKLFNNILNLTNKLKSNYIATNKNNEILMNIINKILVKEEVLYLQKKWNILNIENTFLNKLNKQEIDYLKKNKVFNVCSKEDYFPLYSFQKNNFIGISGDILTIIKNKLNIEFKPVFAYSHGKFIENINKNKCDIIPIMKREVHNFENFKPIDKTITNHIFVAIGKSENLFFEKSEQLKDGKIYVKEFAHQMIINRKYPYLNVVFEKDLSKIFQNIENETDSYYAVPNLIADYHIQRFGANNFKIIHRFEDLYSNATMLINISKEPLLFSIINKTVGLLSDEYLFNLTNKYRLKEYKIEKNYNIYLLNGLFIFLLIILILYIKYKETNSEKNKINIERNKLKQIIDKSSDLIQIINMKGNVVECSESLSNFLGYSQKQLIGLNISKLNIKTEDKNCLTKDKDFPKSYVTKFKRKDGFILDVKINASIIKIDDEDYIYISIIDIKDSIELKKIKELNKNLEEIQKIAKIGSWKYNFENNNFFFSNQMKNILEIEKDNIDSSIFDLIHPKDKIKILKLIVNNKKQNYKENETIYSRCRLLINNKIKYIFFEWINILDDNNDLIISKGYIQDETSDILNKEKQKEISQLLEYSENLGNLGSWKINLKDDSMIHSEGFKNIFELEDKITNIKDFEKLLNLKTYNTRKREIKNYLENGGVKNIEYSIINQFGNIRNYIEVWNLTYDSNGEPEYMFGLTQDITEKQKAKKELESQQAMLLEQNRLAQLGEMMTMIAHQWRQPINTISLWNTAIEEYITKEYKYDKKIKEMNSNISSQIDYMDETIENFRSFYKKDKEKKSFSLSVSITNTINIVKGLIDSNNVNLILDLDDKIIINGFEGELQQVLMVLINNSIDSMEFSDIKSLKISSYKLKQKVYISVKDSGSGINESIKDEIFKPYFSTKSLNGTGLGLYLSKSILEQSFDGKIGFNSSNLGTEFLIILN